MDSNESIAIVQGFHETLNAVEVQPCITAALQKSYRM